MVLVVYNHHMNTPLTIDDVIKAVETIQELPPLNTKWILISPKGQMYQAEPADLIAHLVQFHPLMQPPSFDWREKWNTDV